MSYCEKIECQILARIYQEDSPHTQVVAWFCSSVVGLSPSQYKLFKQNPCYCGHIFISQAISEIKRGVPIQTIVAQYYHPSQTTEVLKSYACPVSEIVKQLMGSFTPTNIQKVIEFLQQQDTQL